MSEALGAHDYEMDGVGEVDLFGLDEFGQQVGMNSAWGALIGAGLGTGTAIAVRALAAAPTWKKYSEGVGFFVGAAASGLLMAFQGTRGAGWAALAATAATNGLRQLEVLFSPAALAGMGAAVIEPLNGVVIEPLNGEFGQFGVAEIEQVPRAYGTIPGVYGPMGVAGPQLSQTPPIDLMDMGALPANSQQVALMGGPSLSGLGAYYGATLFGGQ